MEEIKNEKTFLLDPNIKKDILNTLEKAEDLLKEILTILKKEEVISESGFIQGDRIIKLIITTIEIALNYI
ncbi:hypothetical protein [Xenorhabdus sp. KJ12.1]|uniref:hypothetical protein n=1 Tax=Xenorhabdus sp. KJ12.1 TaxID=1851571 RepID=UPI000C039BC4|nr:hypothetical protein [Xenorhabdus sp. KJ12.1]PHM68818.1 hypothetical protein Xekj_03045 [Xenorhabdus sp. KJ12.1]